MTTSNLDLPLVTESQAGKYITINQALQILDKWNGGVLSRTSSGPPGSPTEGDSYLVDATTGDWSGFALGDLAIYYQDSTGAAAWIAATPNTGVKTYVIDETAEVRWNGTSWVAVGSAAGVVEVTGSKTLALSDGHTLQNVTAAATITVPPNSSVDFALGVPITFFRNTASAVSVSAGSGVTFLGTASLAAQNDSLTIIQLSLDSWAIL